jgi:hypothetical protein
VKHEKGGLTMMNFDWLMILRESGDHQKKDLIKLGRLQQ